MPLTPPNPPTSAASLADALNQACYCHTLDPQRLHAQLETDPSLRGLAENIAQTRAHLFSSTVVFISAPMVDAIEAAIGAIERTMALPAWQAQALGDQPIVQVDHGPLGVFMGYDFHIGEAGPQLIEINTNAGGALLNAALARAQTACCQAMDLSLNGYRNLATIEDDIFAMFQAEWQRQRGNGLHGTPALRSIAIVDDDPNQQYLAPEFELFRQMFAQRGVQAIIADAAQLVFKDGALWHGTSAIDLVYNRVTDFDLSQPAHAALAQAYTSGAAVITPHPHAHALRADKRHLVTLSQPMALHALGVPEADQRILQQSIPACERVTAHNAASLWQRRRQLFFKPLTGFGARAVYRGDKLTHKVWEQILAGDYIAQALVPPSLRAMHIDHTQTTLKFDIRAYTYAGQLQLLAARTYTGQTTNFRTEGGGFAPVLLVPALADVKKCLSL